MAHRMAREAVAMVDVQVCIETLCTAMIEIMEDQSVEATAAHRVENTLALEAAGADIAALARAVTILRRRRAQDA